MLPDLNYLHFGMRFCLLLLAFALPAPAVGQEVHAVKVQGDYDPRRDDTASKVVIRQEEILKFGDTNVLDVLKRLPGVTVTGQAGRGAEVRMRGLGSGYTQVLVNGERMPAGFQLDALAPEMIERIELVRAATAGLSTQAIAGSVNIVLKKDVRKREREFKFSAAGGDGGGLSPRVNVQLADRSDAMSYGLTSSLARNNFAYHSPSREWLEETGGPVRLVGDQRHHAAGHNDALVLAPRANWTVAEGETLTVMAQLSANRFHRRAGTLMVQLVEDEIRWSNYALRGEVQYSLALANGGKFETRLRIFGAKMGHDLWRLPAEHIAGRAHERSLGTTGQWSQSTMAGHQLLAGWDLSYLTRTETLREWLTTRSSREDFDVDTRNLAVYVQDEWTLRPGWSLYLGWRWESLLTDAVGVGNRSSIGSPIIHTLVKLPGGRGDQLRLALTRTHKLPGVHQLVPRRFTSTFNSATDPDTMGNPALREERARGIDAGYERSWGKRGMFSIGGWARRIGGITRNEISLAPSGRWVSRPVNTGMARVFGLELESKAAWPGNLEGRVALARNWSTVDAIPGPDNHLDQAPLTVTLGLDGTAGQFTYGGSFIYRRNVRAQHSLTSGSYSSLRRELDLYASWTIDQQLRLRLAVGNATGEDTSSERYYIQPLRTQRTRTWNLADPVLRLTLELKR